MQDMGFKVQGYRALDVACRLWKTGYRRWNEGIRLYEYRTLNA